MLERVDILIVGGGLVGSSLALALDAAGRDALLLEARAPAVPVSLPAQGDDNDRNLVLARASVNALRALAVWPLLEPAAGIIRHVEVSRAGEFGRVRLDAQDAGVNVLGRVVPGRVLGAALAARLAACHRVQRIAPAKPAALTRDDAGWRVRIDTADGGRDIQARLIVGADGSASWLREALGIAAQTHDYHQTLLVSTVDCSHDRPECAFERLTDEGPVALLPLPRGRRGLVLTVAAEQREPVMGMHDADFVALAQRRFGWKLGALSRPGKRFAHRITRSVATRVTAPRAVLVGNAAQTVHPIGAQGFNLGLRDALTLAELVVQAEDPGAAALLAAYVARRTPDRAGVVAFSHGLATLGCLSQPALAPLRSLALLAVGRIPMLRHTVARHGMGFRGTPPAAVLDASP